MTRDEIKQIAEIVGGDDTYRHFVHRINKEFEASDSDRQAEIKVVYLDDKGFAVIGISPAKMEAWERVFKQENWVSSDFNINPNAHELMYMYIKPEWRNQGHGKKLLYKSLIHAKSSGADSVYSYVSAKSNDSLSFYLKNQANLIYKFEDSGITTAFLEWDLGVIKVMNKHRQRDPEKEEAFLFK